jgi:hypothetical protein
MRTAEEAVVDIPILRSNLIALGKVSTNVFASSIKTPARSHLRFMLIVFAAKQIEHANSLLKLGDTVDTVLVARSMLEGLAQLLWAMKQPKRRPLMWRAFAYVLDWRLLQKQRSEGMAIDKETERRVMQNIQRHKRFFLTKEAKETIAKGKPLPTDPYVRRWYSESESNIFRDIGGGELLEKAYGPFSEWHHWRIAGFGRVLSFDEGTATFNISTSDPSQVAAALASGFQCLWQTMQLFNKRCRLGIGTRLQRLRRDHIGMKTQ